MPDLEIPNIPVLFEDEWIVAIDKPPALVVNRAETVTGVTIQDWAEAQPWFGKWKTYGDDMVTEEDRETYLKRSGIAHRLDRDTSGVMLLAKDPTTLKELMRQFRDRETEKTYVALVHGKFSTGSGTINLPLGRSGGDRERFTVDPEGKVSETAYEVVEFLPQAPAYLGGKKTKSYQGFSLVHLYPKTGRTHQIRVHMSYIKHPLVGDLRYVGRKRSRVDVEWCPRQFLHAEKLCFTHPKLQKRVCLESPLAEDLEKVLGVLRESK